MLSLQTGGWELTAIGGRPALVVGPVGAPGAVHKLAYRVTPNAQGVHLDVIFDGQPALFQLEVASALTRAGRIASGGCGKVPGFAPE